MKGRGGEPIILAILAVAAITHPIGSETLAIKLQTLGLLAVAVENRATTFTIVRYLPFLSFSSILFRSHIPRGDN